jgi:ribosome-binding ATPase YchF (GTP1/OBG family)
MIRMINLKQIENDTRRIYEDCFELSLLEEQLEDMLTALDKNNIEFERGKISRTAFKANESKLKKNSVKIIKTIKELINSNMILIGNIEEDIENQGGRRIKKKIMKKIKKVTEKVAKNGNN